MAKPMEGVKNLDSSTQESFGVWGMVCIHSSLRNWGDPTFHVNSIKDKHINASMKLFVERRESEGVIVPMISKTTKLVLGKDPYFVQAL